MARHWPPPYFALLAALMYPGLSAAVQSHAIDPGVEHDRKVPAFDRRRSTATTATPPPPWPAPATPPCSRPHLPTALTVVGLMITKDDEDVMLEWLDYNAPSFRGLVVFDSSSTNATRDVIRAYSRRCPAARIHYLHERDFPSIPPLIPGEGRRRGSLVPNDQGMRYWAHLELRKLYGSTSWIYVCHPDEFLYHEPELVARNLGIGCAYMTWYAVQIMVRSISILAHNHPVASVASPSFTSPALRPPTPHPSPTPASSSAGR